MIKFYFKIILFFSIISLLYNCSEEENIFNWYVEVHNKTSSQIIIEYEEHSENWPDKIHIDTLKINSVKSIYVKFVDDYADVEARLNNKKTSYLVHIDVPILNIYSDDFE